jgi:hypothetical protein
MYADKFELILEYDYYDRVEYIKKAIPGTRPDVSGWQIFKLFYEGTTSDVVLRLAYANSSPLFDFIANDHLSYKYTPVYKTIIVPLMDLPAGTIFDLVTFSTEYTVEGDQGDLLVSEALYNTASFITVSEGISVYRKGKEAVWQGQTSIKINKSITKSKSIIIAS